VTDTVYRFLPWSRRGLSAAIPAELDGAAVKPRASVAIQVVVAGAGAADTAATLHGPGDVAGLDPSVIVRTIPRAGSTDVEPNYLAAIDFDQPELPWVFTPSGVPASGHLRPWLALVVVRDRPGTSVSVPRGARLPVLRIESGAATELPDLADSWAWAHVQLLDEDAGTTTDAVGRALADRPDRNVSRLVCPRRLEPGQRWIACVVPTFDAGVVRGLGGKPGDGDLQPAWAGQDQVTLPVYYHWSFQTGPQGDFESLARRLRPYEAAADIGRVRMHVGRAAGFLRLPDQDPDRFLDMDGALQAPAVARAGRPATATEPAVPAVPDPTLGQVPTALRDGLQQVSALLADAADGKLDGLSPGDPAAVGPPVYDGLHVRRTQVEATDDEWFREIILDPRCRVAAGLGAEVMRRYQEAVMEACWQQVGDVLATEAALSRARLSLELGRRFQARHLVPLPLGRLLQVTAPLADRTLLDAATLPRVIAPTSLPDRTTDAAMRRYTSARGRVLAGVRRRTADPARAAEAGHAGEVLVSSLAAGRPDVDATRFPVPGIDGLDGALPTAAPDGTVHLGPLGLDLTLDKATATAVRTGSRDVTGVGGADLVDAIAPRPDLRTSGMVTSVHLEAARTFSEVQVAGRLDALQPGDSLPVSTLDAASTSGVLDAVRESALIRRGDTGFLLETGPKPVVRPLGLRSGGEVVVLTPQGRANVTIARLETRLRGSTTEVGELVGRLPAGTLDPLVVRRGGHVVAPTEVELRPGAGWGEIIVRPEVGGVAPVVEGTTVTMPPLVADVAVISRFEGAITRLVEHTVVAVEPVAPQLVAFPLARAVAATLERSDPAVVHAARLDTIITVGGHRLSELVLDPALVPGWRVPRHYDRVMTYPRLDLPASDYLAEHDRTRFCPGIDEVPPDSITLLETNPRFIAAFMGGLNHETNRELLWRSYPTDQRGTPWRRFWKRTDGRPDIHEIHTWGPRGGRSDLPVQTSDPTGNLVLLVRGELLRRYPRTHVVAVRAVRTGGRQLPSTAATDLRVPVFAGRFDPDVSFFGFPLVSADLTQGEGWFFGLMEPVTEPRFGFDETTGTTTPGSWNDVAWPHLGVPEAGHLTAAKLAGPGLPALANQADGVAAALFQRPFKVLVHARHLVRGI
jgi:hypothetical protein